MDAQKISEFPSITTPSLSGQTLIVDSGTTYNTTLESLKDVLVDNVEHTFTGNQIITGNLTVNGQIINTADLPNVTYAELLILINTSGLTRFSYYILTDYATTYWMHDGRGNECNGGVPFVGTVEPLILFATSNNRIDSKVYSLIHHDDEILYDWDYSKFIGDDAFVDVPNFKGVIEYRKENFYNNSAGWDIRTVKFRRWESTAPEWVTGVTYNVNEIVLHDAKIWKSMRTNTDREPSLPSSNSDWVMMINMTSNIHWNTNSTGITFGDVYIPSGPSYYDFPTMILDNELTHNISINASNAVIGGIINTRLLNVAIYGYCNNIHIDDGSYVITIGSFSSKIDIRRGCYYIIIGRNNKNLLFRNVSFGHIFSENVSEVEIGTGSNVCLLGNSSSDIKINTKSTNINFGISCKTVYIGSYCDTVFLDTKCEKISIGNGSYNIDMESDCNVITMSENCYGIEIGPLSNTLTFDSSSFNLRLPMMSSFTKFNSHTSGDLTGGTVLPYITSDYHCTVISNSAHDNYITYYDGTNTQQFILIPQI